MKLAAVVILYNPMGGVYENIVSYGKMVDYLIVIDNSEFPDNSILEQIKTLKNVEIHSNTVNLGVSRALNIAAEIALKKGFKWMLTMDQDSKFEDAQFVAYKECMNRYSEDSHLGIVGINYESDSLKSSLQCDLKHVPIVITSGSVVNLKIYKQVGGFDESLFIDEVDSEYCYRLRKHTFKVCKFQNIYLTHNLGQMISHRNLITGRIFQRNIHSPIRIYYMTRNYLYVYFKYRKEFKNELKQNGFVVLNRVKNAILYSNFNSFIVLYYFVLGVKDYLFGNFGKKV